MVLALVLVALILSVIEQVNARGRSLLVWAVTCLTLALLWPHLPLR